jgi:hypothetical protein
LFFKIMDVMVIDFESNWEQSQIMNWKNDENNIYLFFKRFDLDFREIYKHVINIDYHRMQIICYLLSKIDKAIKICDFLDGLEKNNNEDVDVIKIYILVSHAEIVSRSLGKKGTNLELVKEFFNPVEPAFKYKIRPSLTNKITINMDFADILYKIRCEYTHEGNYTGKIFLRKREEENIFNIFNFKHNDESFSGCCSLIYKEFIDIYMKALVENIKIFSDYKNIDLK